MNERRINQTLAYHVRTAMPHLDKRREYMADQRIERLLPRIFYMPIGRFISRFVLPRRL